MARRFFAVVFCRIYYGKFADFDLKSMVASSINLITAILNRYRIDDISKLAAPIDDT